MLDLFYEEGVFNEEDNCTFNLYYFDSSSSR